MARLGAVLVVWRSQVRQMAKMAFVASLQKWPDWSRLVIRHGCSMNGTLAKTGTHSEGASVQ